MTKLPLTIINSYSYANPRPKPLWQVSLGA